ncbi:MAG: hypothetical protein JW943_14040 [Deltaproteobacteria bacterium]|nr:hypothetical protein [Deltaproteobacteria bacterium]
MAKYKWFVYLFTILLLCFSIGFLVFVLFNLDQPNLSDYSNYALIGYFIAAAVFFFHLNYGYLKITGLHNKINTADPYAPADLFVLAFDNEERFS